MRATDLDIKIYIGTEQRDLAKELYINEGELREELTKSAHKKQKK